MQDLKLSIIIPVYNLEGYIAETLESCLKQDMTQSEYEIICVDDGSKDKSAEIIMQYQEKYPHIIMHHKENGGVSSARNKGLALAKGEYIWFIDGDDLIARDCLNFLYNSVKDNDGDLLWFKMNHFTDMPNYKDFTSSPIKVCRDESAKYDFMFSKGGGGVCVNFFRRALLQTHHLTFHEDIKYSEDVLFCFEVQLAAKNFTKTDAVCYYYRQREGSAMHSNRTDFHIDSMKKLAIAYNDLLYDKDEAVKKIIINKRDFAVKAMLFSIMQSGDVSLAKLKIKELKSLGFYPYPLKKELLIGNETKKQAIINLISFFFPLKWYFMLCVRVFSCRRK